MNYGGYAGYMGNRNKGPRTVEWQRADIYGCNNCPRGMRPSQAGRSGACQSCPYGYSKPQGYGQVRPHGVQYYGQAAPTAAWVLLNLSPPCCRFIEK